jgi:hypothetical protein
LTSRVAKSQGNLSHSSESGRVSRDRPYRGFRTSGVIEGSLSTSRAVKSREDQDRPSGRTGGRDQGISHLGVSQEESARVGCSNSVIAQFVV